MPYATVQDLEDRLGTPRLTQLTDLDDPSVGLVVPSVAQRAIDDASAEIDGYLIGRYRLPLATVPAVLRVHTVTIAHYRLLGERADDVIRDEYKAVREFLQRVADGRVNLVTAAEAQTPVGVGAVMFEPGAKVMGREPAGY